MTDTLRQEVIQLVRENKVEEAYLKLIPVADDDPQAAELLLMLVHPQTAIALLAGHEDEIRQGAESGNKYMMYLWARYNYLLMPYEDSNQIAFSYFGKAAAAGVADARAVRSLAWTEGLLVPVDIVRAKAELTQAHEEGSMMALFYIVGNMAFGQNGYKRNARQAYLLARNTIAQIEKKGGIVPPRLYHEMAVVCKAMGRIEEEVECYRKAFEAGDPTACFGYAHSSGILSSMRGGSIDEMFEITRKGKEMNMSSAYLDVMLITKKAFNGYPKAKQDELTQRIKDQMRKVIELGDSSGYNILGTCYRTGDYGFEENHDEAFRQFAKAARTGDAEALMNMIEMIDEGTAPDGYDEVFLHDCEILALRYGQDHMLPRVINAYREGYLQNCSAEIERYYMPMFRKLYK